MPRPAPDVTPDQFKRDLSEAQLQAHLTSPALAVDTETMGLNLLRDRLCVVQLCDAAAVGKYLGIHMAPLYCTRTVSKLVRTYTDRHGLKDNLLELLDVELD